MFYVIACNVIGRIVDKAPRRVFLAVSLVAMTIFSFMMGPSKMLGMPDNVWVLLIATCLKDVA
jgi:sugar phosphate permease